MIFGFNNKKKEQDVIQKTLQMEDDAFHRNIVALERLEAFLNHVNKRQVKLLQTAIGTDRDHHPDDMDSTEEMCYLELQLACKGLYMCASYPDAEVFNIAVEAFMKDLLEWYGGRSLLDYYDSVEAVVIPMMAALSHTSKEIDSLFETYVYIASELSQATVEEKYDAMKTGVNAWLKAQHILEHEVKSQNVSMEDELITSHHRGTAIDGYKRIIAALTNLFEDSAPLKIFVKMVKQYLPQIANQLPSITEEAIDQMYEQKHSLVAAEEKEPEQIDQTIKIDLYGLEESMQQANVPWPDEEANMVSQIRSMSKTKAEETYSRILALASEIVELVKSLKEEK